MFKSWKSDKKKIKVSFRLQFQAFQVPVLKKPALVISLVPDDVGKPTFKLDKAVVEDGACLWENPVYLTVKFNREPKTGRMQEKLYHFIVSNGASRSGYLGESSVDLADFIDEYEPLTVSLPLKFANSGVILHLTIQRLVEDGDGRFIEANSDLGTETQDDRRLFSENGEQDHSANPETQNEATGKRLSEARTSVDWTNGSVSDVSIENANGHEARSFPEASESDSIEDLKAEIKAHIRNSELMELELQSLRKQVTKEGRRAQELSAQILDIRRERDALSVECKELKSERINVDGDDSLNLVRAKNKEGREKILEMRKELDCEREFNRELKMQLQKTQESYSELIITVKDLDEMIDQKDSEISRLSSKLSLEDAGSNRKSSKDNDDAASEIDSLKKMITDLTDEIKAYREDREKLEDYVEKLTQDNEVLQQDNKDMSSQLEQSGKEIGKLSSMVTELETQVRRLEETLKSKGGVLSESVIAINELESQVKNLEKELEKQAQRFEDELDSIVTIKVEQEQRAIRAEDSLRKAKWENSLTTERLQEKITKVSLEMEGKMAENEKLMAEAVTESEQLRSQKKLVETRLQKANEELSFIRKQNSQKVKEITLQLETKTKQHEQALLNVNQELKQMADEKKHLLEQQQDACAEIQSLKARLDSMEEQNNALGEKASLLSSNGEERKSAWLEEKRSLIKKWNREKNELEKSLELTKSDAVRAQKENSVLKASSDEKEITVQRLQSEVDSLRSQQVKSSTRDVERGLEEIALLKESKNSMENELKEMRERYSEISLKFAEVESERQQLAKSVRTLQGRKS